MSFATRRTFLSPPPVALAVLCLALGSCAESSDEGAAGDAQDITQAKPSADAFKKLVGKWASTVQDVPKTGELPFESNVRSLEFTTVEANSAQFERHKLVWVIRMSKDQTFPDGTYRIVRFEAGLMKGKIAVTEGGNTSSQFDYEIDGDQLRLRDSDALREFERVKP